MINDFALFGQHCVTHLMSSPVSATCYLSRLDINTTANGDVRGAGERVA
jgi:hypothetical protein